MSELSISTPTARANLLWRLARWGVVLTAVVLLVAWATGRMRPQPGTLPTVDIHVLRGAPLLSPDPSQPVGSGNPALAESPVTDAGRSPFEPVASPATGTTTGSSGVIGPDGRLLPALPFGISDAPPPPPPQEGYKSIGFAFLSDFEYQLYDRIDEEGGEEIPQQIPPAVAAYDREQVAVAGFMIPIEMENRQVRSFLLVKSQLLCCFGIPPRMNEWIYCEMRLGKQAEYAQVVPVIVAGELHVGEEMQDGYVMSIYRMYVDKVQHTGGY